MIYVSIDIETSGLDDTTHKMLSFGAIVEDTKNKLSFSDIPKYKAIVLQNEIVGSPRAISMNKQIIYWMGEYLEGNESTRELIRKESGYEFVEKDDLAKNFYRFLFDNGFGFNSFHESPRIEIVDKKIYPSFDKNIKPLTINVAGKNFAGLDKKFLDQLPWWQKLIRVRQRLIDPAIQFCDWENDTMLPSLIDCKVRSGISGNVTHDALEDAWDVIQILRKSY